MPRGCHAATSALAARTVRRLCPSFLHYVTHRDCHSGSGCTHRIMPFAGHLLNMCHTPAVALALAARTIRRLCLELRKIPRQQLLPDDQRALDGSVHLLRRRSARVHDRLYSRIRALRMARHWFARGLRDARGNGGRTGQAVLGRGVHRSLACGREGDTIPPLSTFCPGWN
eukprot:350318-Chlamydomonas_euryale.AAC.7